MASSVPGFVNFRSFGSSGHVASYADGTFLTVWTEFDASGAAYVYGQTFKADGTTLRSAYLIASADASVQTSFSDVTATVLDDGRTIVSWVSSGHGAILASVLGAGDHLPGDVGQISPEAVSGAARPQVYELANGGFTALFRGVFGGNSYLINSTFHASNGGFAHHDDWNEAVPDNPAVTTFVLPNGDYLLITSKTAGADTNIIAATWKPGSPTITELPPLGTVTGLTGIHPAATPLDNGTFVAAWEDAGNVIRAQVFNSAGQAVANPVTFTKPAGGTLLDTPVIQKLASGGFAIAFRVQEGNDRNIYTAAATADGTVISDTSFVGTSKAGDQWDPALTPLSGSNYAVSWMSDTDRGPQHIVELIGVDGTDVTTPTIPERPAIPERPTVPTPPPTSITPDEDWNGTDSDNVYSGFPIPERLNGMGGDDFINGGGGNDYVIGGSGNDYLNGETGNDTVEGGLGNDKIYGSSGKDILTGGAGMDIFAFNTKPSKANSDKITDFNVKADTIHLAAMYFAPLSTKGSPTKPLALSKKFFTIGAKAKDKDDYLVYDNKKGVLYFDTDGSGAKKASDIATLSKNLKMTYKDFLLI